MSEQQTSTDEIPTEEAQPVRLVTGSDGSAVPVRFETSSLRRGAIIVFAVFAAFELILWSLSVLGGFLFLLLLAWLLSIAMEPAVSWFANRGMRRGLATGVVGLLLVAGGLVFLTVFGSLFFTQLAELVIRLPDYIAQTVTWLNSTFRLNLDTTKILDQLQISPSTVAGIASDLAGGIFGVVGTIFSFLFDGLTVLVFAFYFSADGPRLRRAIGSWLPLRYQKVFVQVWDIAVNKTGGFVVSKVVLATMSAFFHCGFFYLINVPYWLPLGIFAGVTSQFIPTIGTYIGVAIPAIFAALQDPIDVIWIIAFATVYQQVENYVFTPRVSRATMDIHPAIALGSVFVGFAFFGPIGAIIGIPLAAAVIAVVETYGDRYELVPELAVRTRGEKPSKPGDSLGGAPEVVVPAGETLAEIAEDLPAPKDSDGAYRSVTGALRRCDAYLDAVATLAADVVDVGPLRVFVSRAPYAFYVRPIPGTDLTQPGSVSREQVRAAAAVLTDAGHPVSFEWIDGFAPALGDALVAQGYDVHRHPLLVRDLEAPPVDARSAVGLTARLLEAESPDLIAALATQEVGFSTTGTARGEAGGHERDTREVEIPLLDYVRERIRTGRASVAVADDAEAGIVACGWHQPVGADTEVVGVATLPAHRRRGAAAALLEVLVADAAAHGVTMALLSAGDDAVARIYENAGFTRIGRTGAAEPRTD